MLRDLHTFDPLQGLGTTLVFVHLGMSATRNLRNCGLGSLSRSNLSHRFPLVPLDEPIAKYSTYNLLTQYTLNSFNYGLSDNYDICLPFMI